MKKIFTIMAILVVTLTSNFAVARNDLQSFSIQGALSQEQAKEKVGNEVRFYFGNQKHGKILKNWGEVATNKKTNAFMKDDQEACTWAFLSALISLRDRALKEGGNAVVNIRSNYKGKVTSSETTFQCGVGNVIAGVALKGKVVKLR